MINVVQLKLVFPLIMMLISKYGLCRSSIRNYANHYDGVPDPNTLLCNYQSCHVSRLRWRNPAMCVSLKNNFQHPILLVSYRPIKKYYKSLWNFLSSICNELYSLPHRTFLRLRYFKRTNLLFRLLWCLLHFQDIQYLSALFAKIFILTHSYVIHIYD